MQARVLSVNIARPATLTFRGKEVRTGIFKEPVVSPVRAVRYGLEGDIQADKRVHGGPEKAIYLYPHEHYGPWMTELELTVLEPGAFGENLTVEGLLESDVHFGDRIRIGSTLLEVTKPRLPCYKLGLKFGRMDVIKRMHVNERSGFYVSVIDEGMIRPGDSIDLIEQRQGRKTIPEVFRMKRES